MSIYTGYFAQLKKYEKDGLIPISIARVTPEWFNGAELKDLAPSFSLLKRYKNNTISEEDYRAEYLQQLDKVKCGKVLRQLTEDDVVLLCYEKVGKFCHRHILAEYLSDSGYFTEEYKVGGDWYKTLYERGSRM